MHCASNTVQLLRRHRLPEPCPPTAPSWTYWLQNLGSHTSAWVGLRVGVRKTEEIKEPRVEFRQCTDTAFKWKMRFSCFPVFPGSAETQVIWGGTVQRLLTAYFISNISANKYQNAFTCVKVIANPRWDVFETQCTEKYKVFTHNTLRYVQMAQTKIILLQQLLFWTHKLLQTDF